MWTLGVWLRRGGSLAVCVTLVAAASCSEVETHYGGPSGLAQRPLPDPIFPNAGGTSDFDASSFATVCDGGAPVGDPACTVKWSVLFDKYVKATGTWKCADALCHGEGAPGATPTNPPISIDNPSKAWASLVNYQITGKRYINPCSKDPDTSAFTCNLGGVCGIAKMPQTGTQTGAKDPLPAEVDELRTWLACGAPNN